MNYSMHNPQGPVWQKAFAKQFFPPRLPNSTGQGHDKIFDDLHKLSARVLDLLSLAPHANNMNIFLLKTKRASKVFYTEYLFREEKFTQLVENYSAGN